MTLLVGIFMKQLIHTSIPEKNPEMKLGAITQ